MDANYDVQVDLVYDVFLKLGFDVSVDGNMVHLNSYDNKSGRRTCSSQSLHPTWRKDRSSNGWARTVRRGGTRSSTAN